MDDDEDLVPMAEAVRLTVQEGDVYHMLSLLVSIPQLIHFEGQVFFPPFSPFFFFLENDPDFPF